MPTIEDVRISKQITQARLAELANVGISTISRLERGKLVSDSTLNAVCAALEISPSDVTGVNIFVPVVHRRRKKHG